MKIATRLALATAVAALGMAVLAGFTLFLGRQNTVALEQVHLRSARQLTQLQKIDLEVREVRFRAAGVLLDLLPLPGAINHLKDKRRELADIWSEVSRREMGDGTPATVALRLEVRQGWGPMQSLLDKLGRAYEAKDNKAVTTVLEDDWPVAHMAFIKPLQALIPSEEAEADLIYGAATTKNKRLALLSLGLALLCTGAVVAFMMLTMRRLVARLGAEPDALATAAQRIAQGDLSADYTTAHPDSVMASMHAMRGALTEVVSKVRLGVDAVVNTSAEIAKGNNDLSGRTEMQASNLQQTSASMAQLNTTVMHNSATARQANQLATSASEAAAKGGVVVGQVVGTMQDIATSSKKISDIIGVIDGIAFQTNILALNAAVEAARAGVQGRGFAVVASEVRSLAQRSADAAKEIKVLIGESVVKVEAGSRLADAAGKSMDDIVSQVKHVTDLIAEINSAGVEQALGIEQVSAAVNQLDHVTQQNAALVEQAAAAANSLSQQAFKLGEVVRVFKLGPDPGLRMIGRLEAEGEPA